MSGQLGSTRSLLDYESEDNTFLGGVEWQPSERLEIGVDGVWSLGEASLDQFVFVVPDSYLAENPNQSYDFSQTHLNSDIDFDRVELGLRFTYDVSELLGLWGGYRFLDYEDDAPYLADTSGEIEYYSFGLAWKLF